MYMPLSRIILKNRHHNGEVRHVKLFRNGRNQAVRIPRDFELEGEEAIMHREGHRLIVEPVSTISFAKLFSTWRPLKKGLPDVSDLPADPVDF